MDRPYCRPSETWSLHHFTHTSSSTTPNSKKPFQEHISGWRWTLKQSNDQDEIPNILFKWTQWEALGQSWRRPGLQPGLSLLLTHLLQCLSVKWGKQYTISFYKTSITHVHLKSSEQRLTPANVSYGYYEIRIYFSVYSIYRLHF